jgi:hypothetical protein
MDFDFPLIATLICHRLKRLHGGREVRDDNLSNSWNLNGEEKAGIGGKRDVAWDPRAPGIPQAARWCCSEYGCATVKWKTGCGKTGCDIWGWWSGVSSRCKTRKSRNKFRWTGTGRLREGRKMTALMRLRRWDREDSRRGLVCDVPVA